MSYICLLGIEWGAMLQSSELPMQSRAEQSRTLQKELECAAKQLPKADEICGLIVAWVSPTEGVGKGQAASKAQTPPRMLTALVVSYCDLYGRCQHILAREPMCECHPLLCIDEQCEQSSA